MSDERDKRTDGAVAVPGDIVMFTGEDGGVVIGKLGEVQETPDGKVGALVAGRDGWASCQTVFVRDLVVVIRPSEKL